MASPTTTNRSRIFSSFRQRSEGPAKPTCIGVGSPWAMDHPASAPRFEAVGDASPSTDASRVARRRHAKCYESSPARDRQVTIRRETFSNTARPPLRSRPGMAENTWTHPRALDQREASCLLVACRSVCYLLVAVFARDDEGDAHFTTKFASDLPRRRTRSPCSGSTRTVKCHLAAGRLSAKCRHGKVFGRGQARWPRSPPFTPRPLPEGRKRSCIRSTWRRDSLPRQRRAEPRRRRTGHAQGKPPLKPPASTVGRLPHPPIRARHHLAVEPGGPLLS